MVLRLAVTSDAPNSRPRSLDGRFRAFLDAYPGAECIDALPLTPEQSRARRADYFLNARAIVVEVKSAQQDMRAKFGAILHPIVTRSDWPLFYGDADAEPFLARHPAAQQVQDALYEASVSALTDQFESANRQIRLTKATFGLPDSHGLLVYLNDRTDAVGPSVIAYCVAHLLNKRTADGALRYREIDTVLFVSETHGFAPHSEHMPVMAQVIRDQGPQDPRVLETCRRLTAAWASHEKRPLVRVDSSRSNALLRSMQPRSAIDELHRFPATRTNVWIREYAQSRQYRGLERTELFAFGSRMYILILCTGLKGSRMKLAKDDMFRCGELFTYFLEEMKHRGIGLEEWMHENRARDHRLITELSGIKPDNSPPDAADAPSAE